MKMENTEDTYTSGNQGKSDMTSTSSSQEKEVLSGKSLQQALFHIQTQMLEDIEALTKCKNNNKRRRIKKSLRKNKQRFEIIANHAGGES